MLAFLISCENGLRLAMLVPRTRFPRGRREFVKCKWNFHHRAVYRGVTASSPIRPTGKVQVDGSVWRAVLT